MTIEAAFGLLMSVFIFFAVATTAFTLKTEAYLHHVLYQSTREGAQYAYVLTKTQQNELVSEVTDTINYALMFVNGVQQGKVNLEALRGFEREKIDGVVEITDDNMLNGLLSMKNNRYLTQAVAKYLFKRYIPGNSDRAKNQFLKNMGVLGGLDGISFAGSWLHTKSNSSNVNPHDMYVTFEIAYRLRGMYYHQFNYHHTIKSSVTLKVRTGDK
ncbi:hypothetical protein J7S27_00680 [Carnobacteriaceae bacterium zg-C25]|nr:hypothetical protein J7S27_00680 [Carnobacteriaceae bacterium zg-C25]